MGFPTESLFMSLLRRFGFEPTAWAFRRFYTPVDPKALVLEVGSGGNPYPRANVLLDAYETTRERHWVPLSLDRPTVLGFAENLPFKDQSFDFVIAAHVLEHSKNPEKFIAELQRVGKAGYIEVPDAFLERVNPYRDHRLEITCRDQTLVIRKKRLWRHDPEVVDLYEDRVKTILTRDLVTRRPFEFHVRYYWENSIAYKVVNAEDDIGWQVPEIENNVTHSTQEPKMRKLVRDLLRWLLSQRHRNASIDLLPLLRCTECYSDTLINQDSMICCNGCGSRFPVRNRLVAMNEGKQGTTSNVL